MDKVTGQCPQTTTFLEKKGERKQYRTEVLPLTNLTPYLIVLDLFGGRGQGGQWGLVYEYLLPARLGYIKMALIAAHLNARVMVTV